MKSTHQLSTDIARTQVENYFLHLQEKENEDFDLLAELYADDIFIVDRKYQEVSPQEDVQQLHHLTSDQKQQLQQVFTRYQRVFDGKLGKHPTAKIDIQLIPGAKPIYQQPYSVSFQ